MHARIVRFRGSPERMQEDPGQQFREGVLPMLRQQAGFKGAHVLLDRASGTLLGMTLWESEQAATAAMQALEPMRNERAAAMGAAPPSVESYEVVYSA
jgi:heme-degrading monooxygenase HmoA